MSARVVAATVTRWWTRGYTAGLPMDVRDARRAEIESDLWESLRAGDTLREMLARLALGVVDDLSWSMTVMDNSTRTTATWSVASALVLSSAGFALSLSPVAMAIRQSLWAFPAAVVLHLMGIVLFVGVRLALDLRMTGWGFAGVAPSVMVSRVGPWSLVGAVVTAVSGMALYAVEPARLAANPAFQLKLAALALAILNAAVFHSVLTRSVRDWDTTAPLPRPVQMSAYLSLTLWAVILVAGRLIAFVGA